MARKIEVEIIGDARSLERAFKRAEKASNGFAKSTTRTEVAARKASPKIAALGSSYVGTTAAVLAFTGAAKASFSELFEQQKVAAQTAAVLKSTGAAANVTAKDVDKLAASLSQMSGVDDEAIQSGENLLLTFTRIKNEVGAGNDIFDQATKAALDLSVAMGEDLNSSVLRVGKALNDPIRGVIALRRAGVQFTEAQEAQIKALVRSGRALEAQKVILKELQTEFGGSAKAAGDTLPGQLNKARNSALNLGATLANILTPAIINATENLNNMLVAAQNLNDPRKGLPAAGEAFKNLLENLPSGAEVLPGIGPFVGAAKIAFHDAGEKAADAFIRGFKKDFQIGLPPINTAGAGGIVSLLKAQGVGQQPGTGTPFLDFKKALAVGARSLRDQLRVVRQTIAVLTGRLARATTLKAKTALREEINALQEEAFGIVRTLRQARQQAAAAKQAAAAARREARQAARERAQERRARAAEAQETKLFGLLGLGPGGAELPPSLKNLRGQLGRISDAVKGTFLDTGKTRSLLSGIRKVLAKGVKGVTDDIRRAVKSLLDDIDQQLKDHESKGLRAKPKIVSTAQLTAGLGLTPDQRRSLEARLASRSSKGTVPGERGSAFGFSATSRGVSPGRSPEARQPINVTLTIDKRVLASVMLDEFQRLSRKRTKSSRGRYGGINLGAA